MVDPDGRDRAGRRSRRETTTGDEGATTRDRVDFVDASTRDARTRARERERGVETRFVPTR
jgi:hypothetical protein|tara:strand:+ start:755 stop:937 length:183 start_codon:yes stop_codon:yes gene_type:complete